MKSHVICVAIFMLASLVSGENFISGNFSTLFKLNLLIALKCSDSRPVQPFVVQLGHQLALLSGHWDVLLEPVAALLLANVLLFLAARLRQRPLCSRR